jgi:hypothetical protein
MPLQTRQSEKKKNGRTRQKKKKKHTKKKNRCGKSEEATIAMNKPRRPFSVEG